VASSFLEMPSNPLLNSKIRGVVDEKVIALYGAHNSLMDEA